LCLRNRGIKDIEFLKNLSNLRDLDLSGNLIHNLEPIANATEMRSLNLSNNIGITTLDPLHKMTKLEKLNVAGLQTTPMLLADIDIVKMFSNLLSINCNYNKNIKDISPLIFCQKLEEVFFDNCLRIGDITPLRHCLFLKKISFENNVLIKHYEFLRELNNISFINLSKTSINQTYIANFMSMPNSPTFKVDENPSAIIKIIFESIRVNAKLFDIIKKWF
jgi:Leucine-rich repeat (LRR) protein